MRFHHRLSAIVMLLIPLAHASFAADAQFSGPSTVNYTVGTTYDLYHANNAAVYFFGWVEGAQGSTITTSGQLPQGLAFNFLPLPLPQNTTDIALEGTPAAGTQGTYPLTLQATANGVLYTYPVTLIISDQPGSGTTLTGGYTGNWYGGASQAGHGFSIEVLPNSTLLAQWYVFTPGGGPTWIAGTGPIAGKSATIQGYQMTGAGAAFPPAFDSSKVQVQPWGTLTFTFYDCNNGQVSWIPTASGYTAGAMTLQRLTIPAGLTCP